MPDIIFRFGGDQHDAVRAARAVREALQGIKTESKQVDVANRASSQVTTATARETVAARARERAELERLAAEYRKIASTAKEGSRVQVAAAEQAARAERQLGESIDHTATAYRGQSRAAKEAERTTSQAVRGAIAGSSAYKSFGRSIAFASTTFLGAAGIIHLTEKAIAGAEDEERQIDRTRVVLGQASKEVLAWAATTAKSMGVADDAALKMTNDMSQILVPMGVMPARAARMSESLVKLAADIGSLRGVDPEAVFQAFTRGIAGQMRGLKQYGIVIDDDRLKAEALRLGLVRSTADMGKVEKATTAVAVAEARLGAARQKYAANSTQVAVATQALKNAQAQLTKQLAGHVPALNNAQKAEARYSLIMKDSAAAQGSFARNSERAGEQQKILHAEVNDLMDTLGMKLLPVERDIIKAAVDWLSVSKNNERVEHDLEHAIDELVKGLRVLWEMLKVGHDLFTMVTDAVGGLENAIKLLIALKVATWLRGFQVGLAGTIGGPTTGLVGAEASAARLRTTLMGLSKLAALTIGIELLISAKGDKGAIAALERVAGGGLVGGAVGGLPGAAAGAGFVAGTELGRIVFGKKPGFDARKDDTRVQLNKATANVRPYQALYAPEAGYLVSSEHVSSEPGGAGILFTYKIVFVGSSYALYEFNGVIHPSKLGEKKKGALLAMMPPSGEAVFTYKHPSNANAKLLPSSAQGAAGTSDAFGNAMPSGATPKQTAQLGKVLAYVKKYGPGSGITYTWGGVSPQTGFDCSGFLAAAYAAAGIQIPHNAHAQFVDPGAMDTTGEERPGDGVYFASHASGRNSGPAPRHCGIYIGNGKFIEYFSSGKPARVSYLGDRNDYMGARRWIKIIGDVGAGTTAPTDTGAAAAAPTVPSLTVGKTPKKKKAAAVPLVAQQFTDAVDEAKRAVKKAATDSAREGALRDEIAALLSMEQALLAGEAKATGKRKAALHRAVEHVKSDLATAQAELRRTLEREAKAAQKTAAHNTLADTVAEMVYGVGAQSGRAAREGGGLINQLRAKSDKDLRAMVSDAKATLKRVANEVAKAVKEASVLDTISGSLSVDIRDSLGRIIGHETIADIRKKIHDLVVAISKATTPADKARLAQQLTELVNSGVDAAKEALAAAQDAFSSQFSRLTNRLDAAFDRETQRVLSSMQAALQAQIDDITRATDAQIAKLQKNLQKAIDKLEVKRQALTPAEAQAQAMQAAHDAQQAAADLADAQQALADAQAGGDQQAITSAQHQLDEILYQQQLAAVQKRAEAERAALDKSLDDQEQALRDKEAAQEQSLQNQLQAQIAALQAEEAAREQAYQDERDAQREALDEELAEWERHLLDGSATMDDFVKWLQGKGASGIFGRADIPDPIAAMADAGAAQGSAFAAAYIAELHAVWEAWQDLLAGQEPTYSPPSGTKADPSKPIGNPNHNFDSGGIVPGVDIGFDSVDARLRPGELVLTKAHQRHLATQLIAADALARTITSGGAGGSSGGGGDVHITASFPGLVALGRDTYVGDRLARVAEPALRRLLTMRQP